MACIKGVNRSASVAFAPDAPYMAAGTMAGAVDLSFSSSANLEIFKLDFQSDDKDLPVIGDSPSSERFNRLTWAKNGSGSEQYSLGFIAGGLVDGNIDIWNPLALIRPEAGETPLVGRLSRHKGPVRGLEFNTITPNLLASGADDGEICIWDLSNPSQPSHFPPLKGSGSAAQGEISFLSWNSKVQHILASSSYNGTTVVWDLKKQKPVISFSDSARRRCSVLQWNPDLATQLVVASDDDDSPSLRLWDMRNIMTPVKEFVGHTRGVIAMSWCPTDSSYLLTCAKDNRTICWDTISGDIVCELPTSTNWNFDVHWYPRIPGVISASSFDGKIGIHNIESCSRYGVGENDFGAVSLRAPKWYKRPVGASFGFGGKVVSFQPKATVAGASAGSLAAGSEVYVHDLVMEHSLVTRSSEFEAAIQNGERSSLRVLCEQKSKESDLEDDQETWGFLKVMFEDDGTARTKLLSHLGFSVPTESQDSQGEISQDVDALHLNDTAADNVGYKEDVKEPTLFSSDNGEDFFNNLPSPKADTPVARDNHVAEETVAAEEPQVDDGVEDNGDPSFADAVQGALVVGDYKGAVALCVSANKMADALVISHVGGGSLWENTRDQYLKMSRSSYLKIVSAMVNNNLSSLVNIRPLKFWKETLALLCSFAQKDEWTVLCDTLASKLMVAGYTLPATLCYICAGNIDKTVEIWSRSLSTEREGKSYVDLLQDLMEKTIVLALATGQKRFSATLCKLVEKYAEILASQGQLTTALEYIKLLGSEELSPELVILRERISLSTESDKDDKASTIEYSQQPSENLYGAEANKHYYQESASGQFHQNIPSTTYNDNYSQSAYGGRGYTAPTPYQPQAPTPYQPQAPAPYQPQAPAPYQPQAPAPYQPQAPAPYQPQAPAPYQPQAPAPYQPQAPSPYQPQAPPYQQQASLFLPSQAPQAPETNFTAPPAQPAPRPFVPATPSAVRNVEKYQQPTLGSQLYPGVGNPAYQSVQSATSVGPVPSHMDSVPGHIMPQVGAPAPPSRGFMPVPAPGTVQLPGMGLVQPPSPTQTTPPLPAVAPPAPPPTVQTADTSNVPAHQKPVVATLARLFNETSEALGGSRANPGKKREIEDNSRKIGALFSKLNSRDISKNAADKLGELCQALDSGDFGRALQIQVVLTTSEWDECSFWLATLKRMIKTRQNMRLS